MFSKEVTIDGHQYLIESNCPQRIWPKLCNRVEKYLIRSGAEAAKRQAGSPKVKGYTKFGIVLVTFSLTLNPQGNPFR